MTDFLETGESCHYHAREYLGCKDWCYCEKFTPYKIDPQKSQTEKQNKENTECSYYYH